MRSVIGTSAAVALALLLAAGPARTRADDDQLLTRSELLTTAVEQIVQMQEEGGQWPYEGVYRVNRELPVGYRIGGTALAAGTLMRAAPDNPAAKAAIAKGLAFVLKE